MVVCTCAIANSGITTPNPAIPKKVVKSMICLTFLAAIKRLQKLDVRDLKPL